MQSPPPHAERRFFLASPHAPSHPRLMEGEGRHLARVLRLGPGTAVLGLDGRGGTWPLVVEAVEREQVRVAPAGEPEFEPGPGEPGSALPFIEVAVAWPRKGRVEAMLDRLVQLGAAAITPLECAHAGPRSAVIPGSGARARLERVLREACKQSRRTWLPRLLEPLEPTQLAEQRGDSPMALLDPGAGLGLDVWVRSLLGSPEGRATRERPLVLVVGPEGGFRTDELQALAAAGAGPVRLGPHVLRIETAAEAALAVVAATCS